MSDLKGIEYKRFEDIKHIREDGSEYWSARELGPALDYAKWENFAKVIKRAMMNFLCTRLQLSAQRAEDIISDFILIITCDDRPFDAVSKMLDRVKLKMTESQLEDFIKLFTDLNNNTRLPQNRGFTPHELSTNRGGQEVIDSISFGPNITAAFKSGEADIEEYRKEILMSELPEKVKMDMLRQLSQIEGKNTTQKKVGRNDPCHCGSGKKYKKCCGK